jgi:peptidoglycan/LPS O-acetylase OafA/YrhL
VGILRLLLALSVVAAHSSKEWPNFLQGFGGVVSVEAFFVISGFYMQLVLSGTYANRNKAFWTNRFLRIYPEYWLVLATSVLVTFFTRNPVFQSIVDLGAPGSLLLTGVNLGIFGSDAIMFMQFNNGALSIGPYQQSSPPLYQLLFVPQVWTLSLELCFYLVAPLLARISTKILILLIGLLSVSKYGIGYSFQLEDPWTYRFFIFELLFFVAGMLLYRLTISHNKFAILMRKVPKHYVYLWIAFIFLLSPQLFNASSGFNKLFVVPLLMVIGILVIIPSLFEVSKHSLVDKKIGNYSYPIYLSHGLALAVAWNLSARFSMNFAITFVCILVCTYLAALPVERLGKIIDKYRDAIRSGKS